MTNYKMENEEAFELEDVAIMILIIAPILWFFWVRRKDSKEKLEPPGPAYKSPAHASEEYWEKYDRESSWTSSIAPTEKTNELLGGKRGNRPLDVLLPRREYQPKRQGWEGGGMLGAGAPHSADEQGMELTQDPDRVNNEGPPPQPSTPP
eukprot:CAMPEP_0113728708 /NCGR_PEP_ID=MMETSP0038_2-20120614/42069_1 /TAXON_ID=2898 /ORGANISM="Cryptomonas paramecium" /LENGTH=149 /DNA_ID=CAMNT_0000660319 /DNA_START=17 /DNA_END=463 /DNA_ORIENTATION=- /assembly_acc=CAM_ASM_000170